MILNPTCLSLQDLRIYMTPERGLTGNGEDMSKREIVYTVNSLVFYQYVHS